MLLIFLLTLIQSPIAFSTTSLNGISTGRSRFVFVDKKGDSKMISVYTYLPEGLKAVDATIVFIMHGHGKNARAYRNSWIKYADKYHFMIIAPLFDPQQWPGGGYSYTSVFKKNGYLQDASLWSFNVIEHLFDAIKAATGNPHPKYSIYGHSEGGQFVHRLVLFLPDARFERAVAANPGWYTMPKFDVKFPYGLEGASITKASLTRSLGRDFVVMLGDRDTDPNHPQLRKTPEAEAQGVNRFERGQNFFQAAESTARQLGAKFGWQLQIVPNAAHQNDKMSGPAAAILMAR